MARKRGKREPRERVPKHEVHPRFERGHYIETEFQLVGKVLKWIFQAKATTILIILNIIVYFLSLTWSQEYFKSLVFTKASLLQGNLAPMASSWFLHANPTHLVGNLLFLFIFGRIVEKRFGFFRMLIIYFAAAVCSDIVAGLIFGQGGIGASGAIAGLIAAAIIARPFNLTFLFFGIPMPVFIVGWIAMFADILGVVSPVVGDNVGHIAHLAGFFAITLFTFFLTTKDKRIKAGLYLNFIALTLFVIVYFFVPSIPLESIINR